MQTPANPKVPRVRRFALNKREKWLCRSDFRVQPLETLKEFRGFALKNKREKWLCRSDFRVQPLETLKEFRGFALKNKREKWLCRSDFGVQTPCEPNGPQAGSHCRSSGDRQQRIAEDPRRLVGAGDRHAGADDDDVADRPSARRRGERSADLERWGYLAR